MQVIFYLTRSQSMRPCLFFLLLSGLIPSKAFTSTGNTVPAFFEKIHRSEMTATSVVSLAQHSAGVASLFDNMKTPATVMVGAMVGLGFSAPMTLASNPKDTKFSRFLRQVYPVMAIVAVGSNLLSVMWATVAVNQLTERKIEFAESVWGLMKRDFELEWVAVNAHFCLGIFLFMCSIGTRSFFVGGQGLLGKSAAGMAMSATLLMISIVNRGVAAGGGDGSRYGGSVISLFRVYGSLLFKRASSEAWFGPLEMGATILMVASAVGTIKAIWEDLTARNGGDKLKAKAN